MQTIEKEPLRVGAVCELSFFCSLITASSDFRPQYLVRKTFKKAPLNQ